MLTGNYLYYTGSYLTYRGCVCLFFSFFLFLVQCSSSLKQYELTCITRRGKVFFVTAPRVLPFNFSERAFLRKIGEKIQV